jgi:hypothetical protein
MVLLGIDGRSGRSFGDAIGHQLDMKMVGCGAHRRRVTYGSGYVLHSDGMQRDDKMAVRIPRSSRGTP